ncbi:murein biosynthesis integral membrane protein MurJ [Xylanimonas sp. McL0601]|uniref:murein biosynthesis integral membrane protein MurJ n=1 Tax=Xylanimonas sp. McL0601 TaxID=3414739 RepID=UPI003CF2CBFD
MRDTSRSHLGRDSLVMTVGTAASRASGLVRTMLLVGAIGLVGSAANAFDIANTLPNMLFALLTAGVLQAVLMPQIMRALQHDDSEHRLDKLLTLATLTLLLLTVVLVALTPLLIRLFTLYGGWSPDSQALAVVLGYWCVPQVFFYGVFAVLGEALNARGQFAAVGWAPMANNVVAALGLGVFIWIWGPAPDHGINDLSAWTPAKTALLGGTATLGIVVQAALLLVALRRGGFRWHLSLGLHGIGLRSASRVVGWTLGAVLLEQVGVTYLKNVTSAAGELGARLGEAFAGNAAYTNALTVYLLPHSLVVVSIFTALFPRMSAAAVAGDLDGVRADMSVGLRSAGIFTMLSAAAMVVLATPLTKALLPSASSAEIRAGAPVLRAMALGLVALGATVMVKRIYFALEDGRSVFVIQVVATLSMVGALWAATLVVGPRRWAVAAGAAYALSTWISVLLRARGMRRKLHGIDGHRVLRLYVRCGVAATVAAAVGWGTVRLLGSSADARWAHAVLVTTVAGLAMAGVYVGLLKAMRVSELDDAIRPVLRRLRRS